MKLTKRIVESAETPKQFQQIFIRDTQLIGLALRITSAGTKSFVVEKRVNGKAKRITLGRYPEITPEIARREAQKILGKIATGIDPVSEKKSNKTKAITLLQVFYDYLNARKSLKETTIVDYRRVLNQVIPDWLDKPFLNITKDMIVKRHAKYGQENSKARANLAMRLLRALFNFAAEEYEDANGHSIISENPIKRLSHTRSWYRIARRDTLVKEHELKQWYEGLMRLSQCPEFNNPEMMQDYFLLILFTGLRRHEAASLKWANVNLEGKAFTLHDTKNRDSHTLPMSDFLYELFLRRKPKASNEFVFPANSRTGHMIEPRKALLKIRDLSGVKIGRAHV